MKKTMLTCDTLDRFEKFINPETLTAEQVQEVEHLAYCANMGAESKESAWTRFCELVKHFLNLDIIDTERHPNIRKAIFQTSNILRICFFKLLILRVFFFGGLIPRKSFTYF